MVRSKFTLVAIKHQAYTSAKTLTFQPVYDQSIPEDQRFQKATPYGQFEVMIDNPVAFDQFTLGAAYYFDATPVAAS